ncbi:MAG: hypothetical protein CMJ96_02215 [Planctomycetes bacterium]|nr:hypothetical protein [Planctomycetota bacterium]
MITWLQTLIEKRGKWLFVALLAAVIVSFVPYISPTGSSSLDLFSDDGRSRDKYFGYDWYDPNDQRSLSVQATVSGAFGTAPRPNQDSWLDLLREAYSGNLEQSEFQKRRTRLAMEAKIALLQIGAAWRLLPLTLENKAIVGVFHEFLSRRVDKEVGITQDGELDDAKYEKTIQNLATGLGNLKPDQVEAILFEDFRANYVDAALGASGYALPLEGELEVRSDDLLWKFEAVAFDGESFEPEPLPFASIRLLSLPEGNATLSLAYDNSTKTFTFRDSLSGKPVEGDVALGSGDSTEAKLRSTRDNLAAAIKETGLNCIVTIADGNGSSADPELTLGLPLSGTPFEMPRVSSSSGAFSFTNNLKKELLAYFESRKEDPIFMVPARTTATALVFRSQQYLKEPSPPTETELRGYFSSHPGEFSRSSPKESIPTPVSPTEKDGQRGPQGLRGRSPRKPPKPNEKKNEDKPLPVPAKEVKQEIVPEPSQQPAPPVVPAAPAPSANPASSAPKLISDANVTVSDANVTVSERNATSPITEPKKPEPEPERPITFEEVREEVLARFLKDRRIHLEREARDLAEERAEDFVSELHALSRKATGKGGDPLEIRNNPGIVSLIARLKPSDRHKATFSKGEIEVESKSVGLPADALRDMLDLPSHRFFSEATYETTDGFAVMLLDARLPSSVKAFEKADFRVLVREFRMDRKKEAFQTRGEEIAEALRKGLEGGGSLAEVASRVDSRLSHHSFDGDDGKTIRERFDKRSKMLDLGVEKAQSDLNKLVELTKERNATAAEQADIDALTEGIKESRERLGQISDERGLAEDFFAVAGDTDTQLGELTGMATGQSTKAGLFVRLHEIIWEKEDEETSLLEESIKGLEARRARESRENLLSDWIEKGRGNH